MPIKIILSGEHTWDAERLERFEDKLRDFLIGEFVEGFTIEDEYTGNSLSPYGGRD